MILGSVTPFDAQVSLDDVDLDVNASGGFQITVTPGSHNLTASATGYQSFQETIQATAGNATSPPLRIDLRALGGTGATGGNRPTATTDWNDLYLGLGAVAVVLVLALVLALRRPPRDRP
jgi:hypothetical protein